MLEIKNLYKSYNKNIVLNNISFKLEQGKIIGLLGPNGVGKTTLLKAIVNKLSYNGKIFIDGELNSEYIKDNKNKILYIPDKPFVYEYLTGNEFIRFVLDILNIEYSNVKGIIFSLTKMLNLDQHLDRLITTYSHGMKQKISLIPYFVSEPKILIMDEPTSGFDLSATATLKEIISAMGKKGTTVIFSTHDLSLITNITDRILILNNEKYYFIEDASSKSEKEIELLYLDIIKQNIDANLKNFLNKNEN